MASYRDLTATSRSCLLDESIISLGVLDPFLDEMRALFDMSNRKVQYEKVDNGIDPGIVDEAKKMYFYLGKAS